MLTIQSAVTEAAAIAARPDDVYAYMAEPTRLPDWAPAFATTIEPAGQDTWRVGEREIAFACDPTARTVDIVAAADRQTGAYARIVPNGEGAQVLFTVVLPSSTSTHDLDAQRATLASELAAVRAACEAT